MKIGGERTKMELGGLMAVRRDGLLCFYLIAI